MRRFLRHEGGATSIEYALIASFVFLAIVAGLTAVGTNLNKTFSKIAAGF